MSTISLVSSPVTPRERYGSLGKAGVYLPPLGLGYLASVLRKHGFGVRLLDCEAFKLDVPAATEAILKERPDAVGISAVTCTIHKAQALAASLKNRRPDMPVIVGGTHISALPQETMQRYGDFDIGVIGEAEDTIIELMRVLAAGERLEGVKGIIFRRNGALVTTEARPLIADLDSIPFPAWDLFPDLARFYRPSVFGFKRLPATSLMTSRGCVFSCSFCDQTMWQHRYREHSAEYVLEMIKALSRGYGMKEFVVYDETFGLNKARLMKLLDLLEKERLDITWSCNMRVTMADAELFKRMKRAGCWGIAFGIESGSSEVLDFIDKGITREQIERGVRIAAQSGLITKGYIMVGTLAETRETIRETMDFVLSLDLDLLTVNHFTPFPGTLDYQRADRYGKFSRDWARINEHEVVFLARDFTREDIEYWRRLITKKFYLSWRKIPRYCKRYLKPGNCRLIITGFMTMLTFIFEMGRFRKRGIFLKIPRARIMLSGRSIIRFFFSRSGRGRRVHEFESAFASFLGSKHAISVGSGTIALYLTLKHLGIRQGDEVLVPAYTVAEIPATIRALGAVPVFIDIEPRTFGIDPALIKERISPQTKYILLVHLYGRPADIPAINAIAQEHGLTVIEDCCQSCGAAYRGRKVGTFGRAGYFSFGYMKNLNTLSGGMISTDDDRLAASIRQEVARFPESSKLYIFGSMVRAMVLAMATQRAVFTFLTYPFIRLCGALNKHAVHSLFKKSGSGSSLTAKIKAGVYHRRYSDMQAALGLEQLPRVDFENEKRRQHAEFLSSLLAEKDPTFAATGPREGYTDIYTQYVLAIDRRDAVIDTLLRQGIDAIHGYLTAYGDNPVAQRLAKNNIYLPVYGSLRRADIEYLACAFHEAMQAPVSGKEDSR